MTKFKNIGANINHNRFHKDLMKLLDKHSGHLQSQEMLALAAKATGQISALMDQRTMTPEMVIQLVIENFQLGNAQIVNNMRLTPTQGNA